MKIKHLVCVCCFLGVAMGPAVASAGFVSASINAVGTETVEIPAPGIVEASFSHSFTDPSGGSIFMALARASVVRLSASTFKDGIPASPAGSGDALQANASLASDQDIIFDYAAGVSNPAPWVLVTFGFALSGSAGFANAGGVAGAIGTADVTGNIFTAPNLANPVQGGIARAAADYFSPVDGFGGFSENASVSVWVPRGATIGISARLEVTGFTNPGGKINVDFSNSLSFNPDQYFSIAVQDGFSPGITANSVSLGLVNNQLPAFQTNPIPEPSSLVLLGMGMTGLFCYGWRKRRKQEVAC